MKQISLTELTSALSDEPKTIAERLELLGITKEDTAGKIPDDALSLTVYGTSFLKFLQDNAHKLDVEKVDTDQVPGVLPFNDEHLTIGERLRALDLNEDDLNSMFSQEALNVIVSPDEFQDFILQHQEKFINKIEMIADKGGES